MHATATIDATPAEVRAWAVKRGFPLGDRGRIPAEVTDAFNKAHRRRQFPGSPAKATG